MFMRIPPVLLLLHLPHLTSAPFTLLGSKLDGSYNGGRFGQSVHLSSDGSRLAVGTYLAGSRGQVSVYELSSNSWSQLGATLTGENDVCN